MSQRILNEREHRRGLVLGLSLAEILILLLFLLLLAFGHRLKQLEDHEKNADKQREDIRVVLDVIKQRLPQGTTQLDEGSARDLVSKLSLIIKLEQEFPALAGKFNVVGSVLESVAKFEPNDPAAALEIARDYLLKLGRAGEHTKLVALEEKVRLLENKTTKLLPKGEATGSITASPKRIAPSAPPALLTRILVLLDELDRSLSEIAAQTERNTITTGSIKKGQHDWPPIITLSEARGYFFASGSAELTGDFQLKLLTTVVEDLLKIIEEYGVDLVEVIGHTDEQRLIVRASNIDTSSSIRPASKLIVRPSNLDTTLIPFLAGTAALDRLAPSDNAGLGLARAASVVRVLLTDERLRKFRILPLSGGQLIEVGDSLSAGRSPGNVAERRRIEIRARRSDTAPPWQGRVLEVGPATKF